MTQDISEPGRLKPLDWPPIHVDVQVSQDQLQAMIRRVEQNFEYMGMTEPHWSVLTSDRYRSDRIEENKAEFFESGQGPVKQLQAAAARCGVPLSKAMTCLELGCGVGRSTIWLAEVFGKVIGADISVPHLQLAREVAQRFGRNNISFLHASRLETINATAEFDAFFSLIVLQHNPPPIIHHLLSTILTKLRPGGIAYFQVPTYRFGYVFEADNYLSAAAKLGVPDMHVIPQPELHRVIEESGCRVLEMREDGPPADSIFQAACS